MIDTHNERIDLNLLGTLAVLLDEQNATRAAARLGVTQSAVSHALSRLRELFDDELLVRAPGGMRPTARAEQLRDRLESVVREARDLIASGPRFDPATSERTFKMYAPDSVQTTLLPALIDRVASDAPRVDIRVLPGSGRSFYERLDTGELDVAIGLFPDPPAGTRQQILSRETFVCLVRKDHPDVGKRMTLSRYTSLPHLLIAPQGGTRGQVDHVLEQLGHRRRVAVVVPQFLIAPFVIARSNLILTVTDRVARTMASYLDLKVLKPPIEIEGYDYSQIWSERYHRDPGHMWFRRHIARISRGR